MFCKSCGKELTGTPERCLNCGARPMAGKSFCPACGAPTAPMTEVCTNCGAQVGKATKSKAWKSRTAGILAIVAGSLAAAEWITIAVVEIRYWGGLPIDGRTDLIATAAFAIVMASAIVAIVGGSFALKKRRWGLALAGSICTIFSVIWIPILLNVPVGIAAIVLVVSGKHQFERSSGLSKSTESDLKQL